MRINWFSPLPPAATDIAHYTSRVLPSLAALADVTLWTTKARWPVSLERFAEVRRYGLDRIPWRELNRADATFYNIGNNPGFHKAIWHVSRVHAGVVVLHDFRLHHFFDGIYRLQWQDIKLYLDMMEKYYGKTALADAEECFNSKASNIDYMAERYPLTDLALESALGVVVHTAEAFDYLRLQAKWPLAFAALPFAAPSEMHCPVPHGPPYRLIVFGYLGRNRRLGPLLEAFAALEEQEKFQLDICGVLLNDEALIRTEIRRLRLTTLVNLHGFMPEKKLDAALSSADLAINLRVPTMGEASGSQLRIWSHALPSLVSEVGWYASLPPDSVSFVRPDHEVSDIKEHLTSFLHDPERFASMGRRGFEYLKNNHSTETYAGALVEIAEKAKQFRLRVTAEGLALRAAKPIGEWLAPFQSDESLRRIASEALSLAKQ